MHSTFKFFIYQLMEPFFYFWNHRYITVKTNSTDQRNFSNLIFTSNYHHNELICSWKKIKRTTHNEYLEHQASISTIFIRANYITKREMSNIKRHKRYLQFCQLSPNFQGFFLPPTTSLYERCVPRANSCERLVIEVNDKEGLSGLETRDAQGRRVQGKPGLSFRVFGKRCGEKNKLIVPVHGCN